MNQEHQTIKRTNSKKRRERRQKMSKLINHDTLQVKRQHMDQYNGMKVPFIFNYADRRDMTEYYDFLKYYPLLVVKNNGHVCFCIRRAKYLWCNMRYCGDDSCATRILHVVTKKIRCLFCSRPAIAFCRMKTSNEYNLPFCGEELCHNNQYNKIRHEKCEFCSRMARLVWYGMNLCYDVRCHEECAKTMKMSKCQVCPSYQTQLFPRNVDDENKLYNRLTQNLWISNNIVSDNVCIKTMNVWSGFRCRKFNCNDAINPADGGGCCIS